MARSANQKIKLLILKDYLLRNSDEGHPVTIPEIINELARYDIKAERKSLYDDIEALRLYGLDIVQSKGNYFVGARGFETPELKLLVDSIQSSKFITQKKTLSLIKKIEELASIYDAQLLERQVYVRNRVKSMNESVYYNVDSISDAINQDKAIRFKYFEFTVTKQRHIRKNGAWYEVSPFALMWDDENYYMLAWDSDSGSMKHTAWTKCWRSLLLIVCEKARKPSLRLTCLRIQRRSLACLRGRIVRSNFALRTIWLVR